MGLFTGFYFMCNLNSGTVADRAFAPAVVWQASERFAAMILCHSMLLG